MKKIDFEVFGPGQYLYFDIGRLIQVENLTGKSAGDIIRNQELNLGILTALLSIGLRQHGMLGAEGDNALFCHFAHPFSLNGASRSIR